MIKKSFIKASILLAILLNSAYAATTKKLTGVGFVAENLMDPVGMAADFIYTGCFILGASFIFAAVVKYVEHRRNPLMVPISTVVFLLLAGILLFLIPFAYLIMHHASPYSLLS